MDLARKTGTTLLAYSGTNATAPIEAFAAAAEDIDRAEHTTPPVVTSAERWTVSFWADKTFDNNAWTPPAGQIARHESHGTGVGRISMLATDSGQRDPAGDQRPPDRHIELGGQHRDDVDPRPGARRSLIEHPNRRGRERVEGPGLRPPRRHWCGPRRGG